MEEKTIAQLDDEIDEAKKWRDTASETINEIQGKRNEMARKMWDEHVKNYEFRAYVAGPGMEIAETPDNVYYRGEKVTTFVRVEKRPTAGTITRHGMLRNKTRTGHDLETDWKGAMYAVVDGKIVGSTNTPGKIASSMLLSSLIRYIEEDLGHYEILTGRQRIVEMWLSIGADREDFVTWSEKEQSLTA